MIVQKSQGFRKAQIIIWLEYMHCGAYTVHVREGWVCGRYPGGE